MPVVFTEYPKWIIIANCDRSQLPPHSMTEDVKDEKGVLLKDKVKILVKSEQDEFAIDDDIRKKDIQRDLKDNHDIDIDLRKYKGEVGLGALEAFYKAAQSDKKKK